MIACYTGVELGGEIPTVPQRISRPLAMCSRHGFGARGSLIRWAAIGFIQLALANCIAQVSFGAEGDEDRHLAEYLWAGVKAEREKLVTGVVEITGTSVILPHGLNKQRLSWQVTIQHSFDYGSGSTLYRISWGPHRDGTYMRTRDAKFQWANLSSSCIGVLKGSDELLPFVVAPDVRLMGIACQGEMEGGYGFDSMDSVFWHEMEFQSVKQQTDGVYELSWGVDVEGGSLLRSVVVNEPNGFTTEGCTLRVKLRGSSSWRELEEYSIRAKWEPKGDTWVPTSVDVNEPTAYRKLNLKLDWHSVNAPIAEDVFDVENMGAPKDTLVVDHRLGGEPFIIAKIGVPDYVPPSRPTAKLGSPERKWFTFIIVGVNVTLIASYLLWRRRRGAKTSP